MEELSVQREFLMLTKSSPLQKLLSLKWLNRFLLRFSKSNSHCLNCNTSLHLDSEAVFHAAGAVLKIDLDHLSVVQTKNQAWNIAQRKVATSRLSPQSSQKFPQLALCTTCRNRHRERSNILLPRDMRRLRNPIWSRRSSKRNLVRKVQLVKRTTMSLCWLTCLPALLASRAFMIGVVERTSIPSERSWTKIRTTNHLHQ